MPRGEDQKNYPLWTLPVWRFGTSFTFPLYRSLRDQLGFRPGDILIARMHVPYVTFRIARPERFIPIGDFGPEVLPPSWPGKNDNATTPDDTARPAPAAPGAGEDVDS